MKKKTRLLLIILLLGVPGTRAQRVLFERDRLPQPVFHSNPGLVELYWTAWEQAWTRVKSLPGLPRERHLDASARDDETRLRDVTFMALFCKYSPYLFPGVETLDNFYYPALEGTPSPLGIDHLDAPPLLAWVESEYYRFTGDGERLRLLLHDKRFLPRYLDWFDALTPATRLPFPHRPVALEKREHGYRWSGEASGTGNDSREREGLLRVDAIAQQALSALHVARLAGEAGYKEVAREFNERYKALKATVNKYYWDEETGTYHDLLESDLSRLRVKTPAAYWAMLAEIPTPGQARRMAALARDTSVFGGNVPWPSVSRDDPAFDAADPWRGGVWIPAAYAGIKALERYGFLEEADKSAYNLLVHLHATFANHEPGALWERYNPSSDEPAGERDPGAHACSPLAPIALFIENVLGFHRVDAANRVVEWRKHHRGLHGIKNLSFGNITADIIGDDHVIQVETNGAFTLIVNGKSYRARKGSNTFK
jgi:hypothetical protein